MWFQIDSFAPTLADVVDAAFAAPGRRDLTDLVFAEGAWTGSSW